MAITGALLVVMGRWWHDRAPRRGRWGVIPSLPSGLTRVLRSGKGDVLVWSLVHWMFGVALILTGALSVAGMIDPLISVLLFVTWPFASLATWVVIEVGGRLHS